MQPAGITVALCWVRRDLGVLTAVELFRMEKTSEISTEIPGPATQPGAGLKHRSVASQ